ncbi:MAG: 5-oxoprolinase subunit PxpB [Psychroserpens sp.]|uniref:5-oxoprolinase subunit PxpB n=1 Tax=Psychroserpens sp. TaxID=2020870 RepID=UPI003C720E9C
MDYNLTYRQFSERSILVEWPRKIDQYILKDILIFKNHIEKSNIKSIVQVNNAYNSLLIIYKWAIDKSYDAVLMLKALYSQRDNQYKVEYKIWSIPVCYDDEFGIDLMEISDAKKMSASEIIKQHSEAVYTVFFIGFLPGFLYLGGLDKRLHFPRKKSPRQQVKKGAVAIGGEQTGIYPKASPGGWHIIGNSPIDFFNPKLENPCFAKAGDRIQFLPISKLEYDDITFQIQNDSFKLKSEILYG